MSEHLISTTSGPVLGFSDTFPLRDKSSFTEPCSGGAGGKTPVLKWLGIPYAQAKRWGRPEPPQVWSEPLMCTEFGPYFPQNTDLTHLIYGTQPGFFVRSGNTQSEERGFNVNVFAPHDTHVEDNLPVMFWLHGGSLESGASSSVLYDPTELIRAQSQAGRKFIVVSGNYRLNLFGFMACPDLASEDPNGLAGNYGLYDCIAMLEWVQSNIQRFGGDPNNVTLFGESAGAFLIGALLVTRNKLFKRAIMQSGFPESMTHRELDSESGTVVYRAILKSFSIGEDLSPIERIEKLRAIPTEELVEFLRTRGTVIHDYGLTNESADSPSALWPRPAIDLIKQGTWNPHLESVILGHTKNEGSLFAFLFNTSTSMGYDYLLTNLCPWTSRKTIDGLYATDDTEEPVNLSDKQAVVPECPPIDWKHCAGSRLIQDHLFESPLESLASTFETVPNAITHQRCKVYTYRLDCTLPAVDEVHGWGAFHTVDIPFIFNLNMMWQPGTAQDETARLMGACWSEFAISGCPDPAWPEYVPTTSSLTYIFSETGKGSVEDLKQNRSDLSRRQLAFWIDNLPQLVTLRKPQDILV